VFQLLNANVALNALDNVFTIQAAAGEGGAGTGAEGGTTTTVQLGQYEALEAGMFSLKNFQFHTGRLSRHNESVRLKSIDSIDGESGGLAALDFLKADVEGFELEMLRGAAATIARHRPLLYLEHNGHDGTSGAMAETELVRLLRSWDYAVAPHLFHTRLSAAQNGSYVESNVLCVPRERMGEARIKKALAWLVEQGGAGFDTTLVAE
jgi:FkbM family methyltransferase